jgi:putative ABC transport system substrate-binding protein
MVEIFTGRRLRRIAVLIVCQITTACVMTPPVSVNEPTPVPVPVPAPAPPPTITEPAPEPVAAPPVRIAILISNDTPGYQLVANEIVQRISKDEHVILNLDGNPANGSRVLEKLAEFSPDQLIAVGLLAAKTGRQMPELPLVFCRVFNYQDHDLISPTSSGVNLLPPFALQLEAWKTLSPDLQTIGVIAGPGQNELIVEITAAAREQDIEVISRSARSDKGTLFEFKRLIPLVQGLWILPDNRILSVPVLQELMAYGAKYDKQIVVFNEQLLKYGALLSVSSSDADVANQVVRLLDDSEFGATTPRPRMVPLTTMRIELNFQVAQELGLTTTPKFNKFLPID